jgi:hypothetical protein
MAELTEWLKIMLGEVARKRDEQAQAAAENRTRSSEAHASVEPNHSPPLPGR